ncbi:hypothetical protein BD311DRAFT_831489, partial [Dichomitus squalens]
RIAQVDSKRCPACDLAPETVMHFLLQCPAYASARSQHLSHLGRRASAKCHGLECGLGVLGQVLQDHQVLQVHQDQWTWSRPLVLAKPGGWSWPRPLVLTKTTKTIPRPESRPEPSTC